MKYYGCYLTLSKSNPVSPYKRQCLSKSKLQSMWRRCVYRRLLCEGQVWDPGFRIVRRDKTNDRVIVMSLTLALFGACPTTTDREVPTNSERFTGYSHQTCNNLTHHVDWTLGSRCLSQYCLVITIFSSQTDTLSYLCCHHKRCHYRKEFHNLFASFIVSPTMATIHESYKY